VRSPRLTTPEFAAALVNAAPAAASWRHRQADVERYLSTFAELHRRFSRALPEDLREELEGVTAYQCEALVFIATAAGGHVTMNDVARNQGVAMSSCTALIDRLQRQGMVERTADPADRRVVRVVPTEQGLRLVDRFRAHKRRVVQETISALSPAELDTLLSLVERMLTIEAKAEEPA
jgi:DNA-binding MarR family transcriptional regulator